jgi:nitrite reductase (NO-forming)
MRHARVEIAPGVFYDGWTFGGTIPGPVIHVEQGDQVEVWLVNDSDLEHSLDFHSGRMAPSTWYRDIAPGDSIKFEFVARDPGVFMAHCGTAPVLAHISNGMYFPMVVRPRGLPYAEKEFVFTQSEFYTTEGDGDALTLDDEAALSGIPTYVAFNGLANQYKDAPIQVEAGKPYRAWVMNAGPNRTSAFHIVGTIFDRVVDGDERGAVYNVQTWNIAPGGGAMFEFTLAEEGLYPFVTHAFSDASKGALGLFRAGSPSVMTMDH